MFSEPLLATDNERLTLNWWEYWVGHCWMTGWQSIHGAFRIWRDLMTDNYADYNLLSSVEDPFTECYEWFWVSLGEDNVYPKEFLEYLMKLADDVKTGKEKVYPMDWDQLNRISDLLDDVELDNGDV
jgi:hypothetical protein